MPFGLYILSRCALTLYVAGFGHGDDRFQEWNGRYVGKDKQSQVGQ